MEDCIFCSIISKTDDAYIVYENEYVCCFFDKYPINKGHILVVPKKHYQEFREVDQESLSNIILASQQVATALEELLSIDGITIMQNNGIFKDVEHYHMHIIPRFKNDGFSWIEPEIKVPKEDFISLSAKLSKILNKSH
ncbi:HIT family protein [Anaerobacillus isosaccharinicus]|uniref:HIT family protein n=1 Tax=Anaerobacillus isosaccharinicus TaxID=1532552 RepID=A0A1S2LNK7_9BACI|nr:HIT family protein [Anaerobacillus isosaccharinicus]MBA5587107.1 HIT family protein [Anaerobacillus isosaccharinicus]QOY34697.1 HIT family protein [Anaerobacillus isosaccharinicus]